MKTIGGGTIRYAGITLATPSQSDELLSVQSRVFADGSSFFLRPPPGSVALGRSRSHGVVEVLWGNRVVESFRVYPGEMLCVADGAVVPPDTCLFWPGQWRNEWRSACASREPINDLHALRARLDGRLAPGLPIACTAPCDGVVEAIDDRTITIRAGDGRVVRLRLPRRRFHVRVAAGDTVRAGDPLTDGWRSHHRLLRAWGEMRLAEHMLNELDTETHLRGLDVPRAHWSLMVRAMLAWRRVTRAGDTGLRRNAVLARDAFERVQQETVARGGAPAVAVTVLRGFHAMARERIRASSPRTPW